MKQILSLILLISYSAICSPVIAGNKADTCNCLANFNAVLYKVAANYAGYRDGIKKTGESRYNRFVDSLRNKAKAATRPAECFAILRRYTTFFNDMHLSLSYFNKEGIPVEMINNPIALKEKLKKAARGSIEGVWMKSDSNLTITIIKDGSKAGIFKGVVTQSRIPVFPVGLVYFTLTAHSTGYSVRFSSYLSNYDMTARQRNNILQVGNYELWNRIYPYSPDKEEIEEIDDWKKTVKGVRFELLNNEVSYLKIISFANNDAAIEAIVKQNDATIRKTPYLIIDLRSNGGGNSGWVNLVPYIYTNTIDQGYSYWRISDDNKKILKDQLESQINLSRSAWVKNKLIIDTIGIKNNLEKLLDYKESFLPVKGISILGDSVLHYPKKVAVIVDNLCGSSTEFFMHLCAQSRKTITYGQNTLGIMDYEGASVITPLPCPDFYFSIPPSKSGWTDTHPINGKGFTPEVVIPLPQDKWVDFVIKDLMKK